MKTHVLSTIAAAVLVAAATPASASTASATLTDFRIELIDLDPNDGITPQVTFQNVQGGTFVAAESGTLAHYTTDLNLGGSIFGAASSSAAQSHASASASLSGDPYGADGASVAVSSSAIDRGTYGASSVWLGDGGSYVTFTLTPETEIVISGDATASVLSTFGDDGADAWAQVFLKLTDYTGLDQVSYGVAQADQGGIGGGTPVALTDHELIRISFSNTDTSSAGGIFFGSLDSAVSDTVAVVPEPGGAALLMAGLGVAAGLGWRRRRHSAR